MNDFYQEIRGIFDDAIEQVREARDDLAQLNDSMKREILVREAVRKIEASGILSDVELSALKIERCGGKE